MPVSSVRSCYRVSLLLIFVMLSGFSLISTPNLAQDYPFNFIKLDIPRDGAGGMAWSPDGKLLAVGVGTKVNIYDASLMLAATHETHYTIRDIDWNGDGTRLAVSLEYNRVEVWNMEPDNSEYKGSVLLEKNPVTSLTWGTDNPQILLRIQTGAKYFSDDVQVYSIVKVWNSETEEIEVELPEQIDAGVPVWGYDGTAIITSGLAIESLGDPESGFSIDAWDSKTGEHITGSKKYWTARNTRIVLDQTRGLIFATEFVMVTVLNGYTFDYVGYLYPELSYDLVWLAVHPTLPYVAISDKSGNIEILNMYADSEDSDRIFASFHAFSGGSSAIEWNADGTKLASINSTTIYIWDTSTLPILPDHSEMPTFMPYPTSTPR